MGKNEDDIILLLTREEAHKLKLALSYVMLTANGERDGLGPIWERLVEELGE